MSPINCLIADDEQLAREILEGYIATVDTLNLVATCSSSSAVFNALKRTPVDLLFLDIQMPQLSGLDLLRSLTQPPAVIITSAHREYALEGYELNVVDYLLKPIALERFLKAVDKYDALRNLGQPSALLPAKEQSAAAPAFIFVRSDKKMVRVLLSEILYIEGLKDYVKIQMIDKPLITYQTLTYFEEKLPADYFMRVHRSYIVSLSHITSYSASQLEIGKYSIPIGSSYSRAVLNELEK